MVRLKSHGGRLGNLGSKWRFRAGKIIELLAGGVSIPILDFPKYRKFMKILYDWDFCTFGPIDTFNLKCKRFQQKVSSLQQFWWLMIDDDDNGDGDDWWLMIDDYDDDDDVDDWWLMVMVMVINDDDDAWFTVLVVIVPHDHPRYYSLTSWKVTKMWTERQNHHWYIIVRVFHHGFSTCFCMFTGYNIYIYIYTLYCCIFLPS